MVHRSSSVDHGTCDPCNMSWSVEHIPWTIERGLWSRKYDQLFVEHVCGQHYLLMFVVNRTCSEKAHVHQQAALYTAGDTSGSFASTKRRERESADSKKWETPNFNNVHNEMPYNMRAWVRTSKAYDPRLRSMDHRTSSIVQTTC